MDGGALPLPRIVKIGRPEPGFAPRGASIPLSIAMLSPTSRTTVELGAKEIFEPISKSALRASSTKSVSALPQTVSQPFLKFIEVIDGIWFGSKGRFGLLIYVTYHLQQSLR